jgi:hypothetical protein
MEPQKNLYIFLPWEMSLISEHRKQVKKEQHDLAVFRKALFC